MAKDEPGDEEIKRMTLGDAIGLSFTPLLEFVNANLDKRPRDLAKIVEAMSSDDAEALVLSAFTVSYHALQVSKGVLKANPHLIPKIAGDAIDMKVNLLELLS